MSEHQYINTINKILTGNEQEIETAESVFSEHKKNDLNEFLLELSNVIMGPHSEEVRRFAIDRTDTVMFENDDNAKHTWMMLNEKTRE
mmetsp:Transcript_25441/g.22458  ORF Transcript_25441/g.22458 Transcript_25441/m.22458 type:complete len:88 (+) Transcript_25441:53-316(+)